MSNLIAGAAELESFPSMLKQLWEPLGSQLADRRSSIVKQACHLLMLLAREMHLDFESSAEYFIPVSKLNNSGAS
jgi:CLIP-associating protein 1/2